jgi:hypothetical protein
MSAMVDGVNTASRFRIDKARSPQAWSSRHIRRSASRSSARVSVELEKLVVAPGNGGSPFNAAPGRQLLVRKRCAGENVVLFQINILSDFAAIHAR